MNADELAALLKRRPYVPLRIQLTGGESYDIRHPGQVLVLRTRLDIGLPAAPESGVFDRVEYCSPLHIVRVEELASVSPENN